MSTEYCWRPGIHHEGGPQRALVMQPNGLRWVVLEGTAAAVWCAFSTPRSIPEAAAECMRKFEGELEVIIEEIRLVVSDWEVRGLLVRSRADS